MKRVSYLSFFLIMGDVLLFYGSLAGTLLIRYPRDQFSTHWDLHSAPFTILLALWIIIFYMGGLYERRFFKATAALEDRIVKTMIAAVAIGVMLFYIIPSFGITPKRNLIIHSVIMMLAISAWRMYIARFIAYSFKIKTLFFGVSKEVETMIEKLRAHPQLGYEPAVLMIDGAYSPSDLIKNRIEIYQFGNTLPAIIKKHNISLVVSSPEAIRNDSAVKIIYEALPFGISFMDFPSFYERINDRIPVSLINDIWFLENLAHVKNALNDFVKRTLDITLACIGGIILIFLFPWIAFAIKINTPGPIYIRQTRVGKNGKPFSLIKFRTMRAISPEGFAEESGKAQWAKKEDPRITRVGSFLRKTHLDELPQVWNIFKGDLSVVGPRPERPEFIKELEKIIPHYNMRHLIKPGVTGWAQIRMPGVYAGSIEETTRKLQYDLFYIKYHNVVMDIAIILKTILLTLTRRGR